MPMLKNLPALPDRTIFNDRTFRFIPLLLLLLGCFFINSNLAAGGMEEPSFQPSLQWYRSNASGIALEYIPSSTVALRNEYCVSVGIISLNELPGFLVPFYDFSLTIESRMLYQNAELYRQQWILRDNRGVTRVNASGNFEQTNGVYLINEEVSGFIDVYDENHSIISERQFINGSEILTFFSYSEGLLLKADIWMYTPANFDAVYTYLGDMQDPPVITDYYRYTRSYSLRAIERIFHSGYDETSMERISFPAIIPGMSREPEFMNPGLAMATELLGGDEAVQGRIIYTTDSRGKILTETMLGEDEEILGELHNTWTGDRLDLVLRKSGDDEWLTEYEYDNGGDRILERNIKNGVLERTVRTEGNRETEELYMDGRIVLRAIWEDGRKISEERIR